MVVFMNNQKRLILTLVFFCGALPLSCQPVTPTPEPQEGLFSRICTKVILAPLTFIHFCVSSYTFIKRDKKACDLVSSRNEIDSYSIEIMALKKNKRNILRSKTKYQASFTGFDLYKVTNATITAIKKLNSTLLIIAKPFITVDAGPTYTLKAFTTEACNHEQLQKDLIDVFFIPESETLSRGKKIAVGAAPVGLAALVLLFLVL